MEDTQREAGRVVQIGTKIIVELDSANILAITIGGPRDGNPTGGVISCDAPLSKAILGKAAGEVVSYRAAGRERRAKILEIATVKTD